MNDGTGVIGPKLYAPITPATVDPRRVDPTTLYGVVRLAVPDPDIWAADVIAADGYLVRVFHLPTGLCCWSAGDDFRACLADAVARLRNNVQHHPGPGCTSCPRNQRNAHG